MTQSSPATRPGQALESIDANWLRRAFAVGIHQVIADRDYINKINVFPVPDSDTGSNLAFTMQAIAAVSVEDDHAGNFLTRIADRALDGARGNSGAIFAQYLQGFAEAIEQRQVLTAADFANAAFAGSQSAQSAIAEPREGTMLSVMHAHALALRAQLDSGVADFAIMFQHGLEQAREALARTPDQLEVLREAGVVDAGGQGFVDWLEGIAEFIETGKTKVIEVADSVAAELAIDESGGHQIGEQPQHRFCTECVVTGDDIDRNELRDRLTAIDSSSLVIAGTKHKVRVHIHVDNPAEAFVACEDFGSVGSQKADDMLRQTHAAHVSRQKVAVVTDTAADLPDSELERLGIHVVPVRVNFGDRQYLDKVSLTPTEFYQLMQTESVHPKTSQPPAGDYRRLFEFLGSHYESVLSISLSSILSGTWQAAESASRRVDREVVAWDTLNAAAGQGLLVMYAGEAAQQGFDVEQIQAMLEYLKPRTRTYAVLSDLSAAVRGGRVSPRVRKAADWFRLTPILGNTQAGELKAKGVLPGRHKLPSRFARWVRKRYRGGDSYRLIVGHCGAPDNARKLRDELVRQMSSVHSTYIAETGPAVGVHAGPGTLIIGIQPYIAPDDLAEELFGAAASGGSDQ